MENNNSNNSNNSNSSSRGSAGAYPYSKGAQKLRKITVIALFCAFSYMCVMLLPKIKVMFLSFDIKDAVMAVGSMYFGPLSAVVMTLLISVMEFLTVSDTGVYGLIMNFISSTAFCVTASLIYKYNKRKSGAVAALLSAVILMTAVMMCANLLITPHYMGVSRTEVAGLIPTLFLPFNLAKGLLNAAIVMLVYKPLSAAMKSQGVYSGKAGGASFTFKNKGTVVSAVISAAVIAAVLVFLFVYLKAGLSS